MEVDRGALLEVGLLDGVGVMWVVGRAEEEKDEVTRGKMEEITGVEAAVGVTKAEPDGGYGTVVGLVNAEEWDTGLEAGVYCRVEPTELEAGVRGDVIEEGGKEVE